MESMLGATTMGHRWADTRNIWEGIYGPWSAKHLRGNNARTKACHTTPDRGGDWWYFWGSRSRRRRPWAAPPWRPLGSSRARRLHRLLHALFQRCGTVTLTESYPNPSESQTDDEVTVTGNSAWLLCPSLLLLIIRWRAGKRKGLPSPFLPACASYGQDYGVSRSRRRFKRCQCGHAALSFGKIRRFCWKKGRF